MTSIGIVKFWNVPKGWGFLQVENKPDLFVHASGLSPTMRGFLIPGDRVRFRVVTDRKADRLIAADVRPAPTVSEAIQSMKTLRGQIDHELTGTPGANAPLTDLRHILTKLEQLITA